MVFDDLSVLNSQTNQNLGKILSFFLEEFTLLSTSCMFSAFYEDVVFEKFFACQDVGDVFSSIALMFEGHTFQVVVFGSTASTEELEPHVLGVETPSSYACKQLYAKCGTL